MSCSAMGLGMENPVDFAILIGFFSISSAICYLGEKIKQAKSFLEHNFNHLKENKHLLFHERNNDDVRNATVEVSENSERATPSPV